MNIYVDVDETVMDYQPGVDKTDYTLAYPDGIAFRSQTTKSYPAYDLANRITLPLNVMPTSIMEFALFMDKYKKIPKNNQDSIHKKVIKNDKEYEKLSKRTMYQKMQEALSQNTNKEDDSDDIKPF
mgnify:CR=1 FL=1